MVAYNQLIPIFVLTGFLGSGKTTLLNRMLRHSSLKDAAVLINEFGEVGLDHLLVEQIDDNTVLLEGGCLCCTIRDDLKETILNLDDRRARGEIPMYERMVIETTGLAEPSPILFTLLADQTLRYHYRLATVITTVDAVNGWGHLERQEEAVKQATIADRIVLTKIDIAAPAQITRLQRRLKQLNPSAELVTADHGAVDIEHLLQADLYDPATRGKEVLRWIETEAAKEADSHDREPGHDHDHDPNRHDAHIHSFCLIYEEPIDWTAFGIWLTMLLHTHGENVLRVKGMLNVKQVKTPVVINGVQHIVHPPMHLDAWPDADRRSRIIFIVRDIERQRIEESLEVFNAIESG